MLVAGLTRGANKHAMLVKTETETVVFHQNQCVPKLCIITMGSFPTLNCRTSTSLITGTISHSGIAAAVHVLYVQLRNGRIACSTKQSRM